MGNSGTRTLHDEDQMEHWEHLEPSLTRTIFLFLGPTRLTGEDTWPLLGVILYWDIDEVRALSLVGPFGIFDSMVLSAA